MAAGTKASQKPRIFTCGMCQITIPYVYYGRQPKSAPQVVFLEEAFIAQDPFATEPRPLCLGSKCAICQRPVCVSCSIFYTKRFCGDCGLQHKESFPPELHSVLGKLKEEAAK
mmetsp:Transcript_31967/g.76410  ORF Transcript_31967/g.76410 Transcript_31967/m.76410 type:complete len:113 (-) Transcript_31967:55-393(-)